MEEQEKQVALLKTRIATLEGKEEQDRGLRVGQKQGGTSVDDWSIKVRCLSFIVRRGL